MVIVVVIDMFAQVATEHSVFVSMPDFQTVILANDFICVTHGCPACVLQVLIPTLGKYYHQ